MKKSLFFVAIATLFIASCQKELNPSEQNSNNDTKCFKASIEQLSDSDTKATINGSNQLVWATGDKIGIYFDTLDPKNQAFSLSAGEGTISGTFTRDASGDYSKTDATYAFFPWQGTAYGDNNVYSGTMYFKLKDDIWGYDNGDMLTPLVAKISSSDDISFKHVGAAVKLTIKGLVSGTYATTMTVKDQQITGDYSMDPENAGSEAIAPVASNNTLNHITLHSWKSSGDFSWIFPVPELTKPKLKFEIVDNNGVPVWSRSLAAQANDLKRGEILIMPDKTITPYEAFSQDDACTWSFSGNINGSTWIDNVPMMSDGRYWILAGFTFKDGDQFKIRKDKKWDEAYPASNWKFTSEIKGAKDIIFDSSTHSITVVDHDFPYPAVEVTASIKLDDSSFADWALIPGSTNGSTTLKVASDATNLYFYIQRTSTPTSVWGGAGYVWVTLDTDNNASTGGSEAWGEKFEFAGLIYPYAGTSAEPAFNTSPGADSSLYGEIVGTTATYEFLIPRSKLPSIPSSAITVKVMGNKDMSTTSISRKL